MATHTTYRLRMTPNGDAAALAEAMIEPHNLPLSKAREADFNWFARPALIGPDHTFANHIPENDFGLGPFWSYDGSKFTFCADLLSPHRSADDLDGSDSSQPNRQEMLLSALTNLCNEPEGTIVGGWQGEHSNDWNPLVFFKGKIRLAYAIGTDLNDKIRDVAPHPSLIDLGRISMNAEDDTVCIDRQASHS